MSKNRHPIYTHSHTHTHIKPFILTSYNVNRSEELVLTEGERINLTCAASRGLPAPVFTWQTPVNLTSLQVGIKCTVVQVVRK